MTGHCRPCVLCAIRGSEECRHFLLSFHVWLCTPLCSGHKEGISEDKQGAEGRFIPPVVSLVPTLLPSTLTAVRLSQAGGRKHLTGSGDQTWRSVIWASSAQGPADCPTALWSSRLQEGMCSGSSQSALSIQLCTMTLWPSITPQGALAEMTEASADRMKQPGRHRDCRVKGSLPKNTVL